MAKSDVAIGLASQLVEEVALPSAMEPTAAKANSDDKAAASKESPANAPSFPNRDKCCMETFDKVENSKVLELPMAICGTALIKGERAVKLPPPGRDADHCEASDLVLALVWRPTQSVEKAQDAIVLLEESMNEWIELFCKTPDDGDKPRRKRCSYLGLWEQISFFDGIFCAVRETRRLDAILQHTQLRRGTYIGRRKKKKHISNSTKPTSGQLPAFILSDI